MSSQPNCSADDEDRHTSTNRRYFEGSQCDGLPGEATFQELLDWLQRLRELTASDGSTAGVSVDSGTMRPAGPETLLSENL